MLQRQEEFSIESDTVAKAGAEEESGLHEGRTLRTPVLTEPKIYFLFFECMW